MREERGQAKRNRVVYESHEGTIKSRWQVVKEKLCFSLSTPLRDNGYWQKWLPFCIVAWFLKQSEYPDQSKTVACPGIIQPWCAFHQLIVYIYKKERVQSCQQKFFCDAPSTHRSPSDLSCLFECVPLQSARRRWRRWRRWRMRWWMWWWWRRWLWWRVSYRCFSCWEYPYKSLVTYPQRKKQLESSE